MNSEWNTPLPERLARPSYAPPLLAVGLMCLLWGIVTTWIISVIGILIAGVACGRWIGDLRRDARDILANAVERGVEREE